MKKLHTFAFYALVTPAIALGSGAVLAQETTSSGAESGNQSSQQGYDSEGTAGKKMQGDEKMQGDQKMQGEDQTMGQSGMQNQNYTESAPASGMQASNLIGAEVNTTGDESVGTVNDLIIDQDGKVIAVVVGVGGFLGMGEKNVAINWDQIEMSGIGEQKLRIDQTRESLTSAPEFQRQEKEQEQ